MDTVSSMMAAYMMVNFRMGLGMGMGRYGFLAASDTKEIGTTHGSMGWVSTSAHAEK